MRLWHYKLLPHLPKSQLLAQWRELNSIFKKQDKHILINYIYNYPKSFLKNYSDKVIAEMYRRGYKINSFENYNNYFDGVTCTGEEIFEEHNHKYLSICYYNLKEKYIRKQKDFDESTWWNIAVFYFENYGE